MKKFTLTIAAVYSLMLSMAQIPSPKPPRKPAALPAPQATTSPAKKIDYDYIEISFEDTVFDFGTIPEGRELYYTFKFKNIGYSPLVISNVREGCSNTAYKYTSEEVMPGKSGVITVGCSTYGRVGPFHHCFVVNSNAKSGEVHLFLTGNVKAISDLPPDYELLLMPEILFEDTTCDFDTIMEGSMTNRELRFKNVGKEPLIISDVRYDNGTEIYDHDIIYPGKSGSIIVKCNTKLPGPFKRTLTIKSNARTSVFKLSITGYVKPKPLVPQPEISFETLVHDFDTIPEGLIVFYEFKFTNTGKDPLILIDVAPRMSLPKWPREPVLPGQSSIIGVSYRSEGRAGSFTKIFTITSNAKTNPIAITIKGYIKPRPLGPPVPTTPRR